MAYSPLAVPKRVIPKLRNLPRDIFESLQGNAPAVGATTRILVTDTYRGYGLDAIIHNTAAAAGNATITIDMTKVITLGVNQIFTIDNILYTRIDVARAGAAAINVDVFLAGVSFDLIKVL